MDTNKPKELSGEELDTALDESAKRNPLMYINPAFILMRYIQYSGFFLLAFGYIDELTCRTYCGTFWFSKYSLPYVAGAIAWPAWVRYRKSANGSLIVGFVLYFVAFIFTAIVLQAYI